MITSTLRRTCLAIIAMLILFTFASADFRDTPAGTLILSTNTIIFYSNAVNVQYTNLGSNFLSGIVQAIYGFTNYGTVQVGITNTNYPTQPGYFFYAFSNEGNTNTTFQITHLTNWIPNYDSIAPVPGDWTLDILSATNPDVSLMAWKDSTNVDTLEDDEYAFWIKIVPPANAANETGVDIYITNLFTGTPYGIYTGTNNWIYGGTNFLSDKITFRVVAPDIKLSKSMKITNISGPYAGDTTTLVPGSIITYTLGYSNKGSMPGLGAYFEDILANNQLTGAGRTNYVEFLSGSITTIGGVVTSTNFMTNSVTVTPSGISYNVDSIKFDFGDLPAKTGGTIEYKVVVK